MTLTGHWLTTHNPLVMASPVIIAPLAMLGFLDIGGTDEKQADLHCQSLVFVFIDESICSDPRHHRPQISADLFNLVCRVETSIGCHRRIV